MPYLLPDLITAKTFETLPAQVRELKRLALKAAEWIINERGCVSSEGTWSDGDWWMTYKGDQVWFFARYTDRRPAIVMQYMTWATD